MFSRALAVVFGESRPERVLRGNPNRPFVNRRAYLVCYDTTGPDLNTAVVVRNQFGSQRLLVRDPETVCVSSKKLLIGNSFRPIRVPIDHFQCYNVEPLTSLQRVGQLGRVLLTDQFGHKQVSIGAAVRLCAPVDKNGSQIQHPATHLVCYQIGGAEVNVRVEVKNQFERKKMKAISPELLCVPSSKVVVP